MPAPVSVIVAGVSGSGKSTVGRAAAALAGVPFIDGDDLHPDENVALMSAGTALTDSDREPWLDAVAATARDHAPCAFSATVFAMNKPVSVILAGASGSGKTTVGRAVAKLGGVHFIDGDDLHPPHNVELMAQGTPLTDEERAPWLAAVAQAARDEAPCVVACSALTRRYRQWLREAAPESVIVMLEVPPDELRRRLEQRVGHFMKASMLDSQLELREPPVAEPGVMVLDGSLSVDEVAAQVAEKLFR